MEETYGLRDSESGLAATVAWLTEELGELAQAVRKGGRDEQLHELGDVLAWLASWRRNWSYHLRKQPIVTPKAAHDAASNHVIVRTCLSRVKRIWSDGLLQLSALRSTQLLFANCPQQ